MAIAFTRADQGRQPSYKLKALTVAQLNALAPPATHLGHIAYVTNGSAGTPCLAACDGTNWRVVAALGATISAT